MSSPFFSYGDGAYGDLGGSASSPKTITAVVGHGIYSGKVATVAQNIAANTVVGVAGQEVLSGKVSVVTQPHSIVAVTGHGAYTGQLSEVSQLSAVIQESTNGGIGYGRLRDSALFWPNQVTQQYNDDDEVMTLAAVAFMEVYRWDL